MSGLLWIVATPIGNLGDITLRAIETLRTADRILAEDTRRTRALLSHLGIPGKPVDRFDAQASDATIAHVVERLANGERIALVTDAGTPVVSDPGTRLVKAAAHAKCPVVPIPGASAVLAAISVSGLVSGGFRFIGFLPRGGPERRAVLERVRDTPEPVVLFESPERTQETLCDLARMMPEREVVVARELTKMHEEVISGTLDVLSKDEERVWIGEVTIVLGEAQEQAATPIDEDAIDARIDADLAKGRRAKDIAETLALETGQPKRELYARVIARRR